MRSLFVLDVTTHYALGFCPDEEYLCGLCTETVSNRLNWGVNGRAGLESDISKDTICPSHDTTFGCVVDDRLLCLDMTWIVRNLEE